MSYIKKILRYLLKKLLLLIVSFILLSIILVVGLDYVNPPSWAWKIQRQLNPPKNYHSQILHHWVKWENISDNMKLAVIASEDQLFSQHMGFDFDSIMEAINANAKGGRVRGASTISQQTAKNLFLWPSKNFIRKGIEVWFTGLLEIVLSKQRILELYLNLVEFGPGIFGVEAASQQFFNKSSATLTVKESARLASVLPNPYRFSAAKPSKYILERTSWIEKQMGQLGHSALP